MSWSSVFGIIGRGISNDIDRFALSRQQLFSDLGLVLFEFSCNRGNE